jgi:hypothetical protein
MKIIQDFPFQHCDSCPECVLNVNQTTIFGDDSVITNQINVSCRNAELCKRLEEVRNGQVESDILNR